MGIKFFKSLHKNIHIPIHCTVDALHDASKPGPIVVGQLMHSCIRFSSDIEHLTVMCIVKKLHKFGVAHQILVAQSWHFEHLVETIKLCTSKLDVGGSTCLLKPCLCNMPT